MGEMFPMFPRVPQEGGLVQGWESVCWGVVGIYQDSKILFFQDVPWCFKISKIPKFDLPRCTKIPRSIRNQIKLPKTYPAFSNILQIYQDLLIFQDHPNCCKISKILLSFHHVGFLCFSQSLTFIVFDATKIISISVTPSFGPGSSKVDFWRVLVKIN